MSATKTNAFLENVMACRFLPNHKLIHSFIHLFICDHAHQTQTHATQIGLRCTTVEKNYDIKS